MKSLSIIVADDVEGITSLVRHWLEEAGHTVYCASTGHEVMRLLQQRAYDLVITDVLMPDSDGLEVIFELKRSQPWARILAISGGGRHMQAVDCLKMASGIGAHAVLLKPFNREQLLESVTKVCPEQNKAAS